MLHEKCPDCLMGRRLISLDIETTGLSRHCHIIELGVVEVVSGKVVREYSKLFGGGHSPVYLVRNVHHIPDSDRAGKPTFSECAGRIASYLSGAVLVTHNGNSFDIPMIQGKLKEAGEELRDVKSLDTLQLVRRMRKASEGDGRRQSNSLGSVCREFGLSYGGDDGSRAHRGLEDAEAALDLLFHLVNSRKVDVSV